MKSMDGCDIPLYGIQLGIIDCAIDAAQRLVEHLKSEIATATLQKH